jgi:predicted AlkP superfamily phosphohydrolase/phosphomutase
VRAPLLLLLALGIGCRSEPPPVKVVVLGFDGASWDTIEPSIRAGKLPFLEKLRSESAWGPLETFKPTKSPVIWTSIATGMTMQKHGILDFVYLKENELPVPFENSERREPSLWQILDYFGKRSVVINWFVTYPPDAIDGVMVSNRFRRGILLDAERRARMRDTVHPEELFDRLAPMLELDFETVRRERDLPDLRLEDDAVLKDYPTYVLQDALVENVAFDLYRTEKHDFFAAYFRLPDIVQHAALRLVKPGEEIADVLLPFYRYMERIVERAARDDAYLVVLSDHGFTLHAGGYDHYHIPQDAPPPAGMFLMQGPAVRPGRTTSMSVYDVAPTLLHLFGLPVGKDMDGKAATYLLNVNRTVRYEAYSRELMKRSAPGGHQDLDREIQEKTLKELKALGYIP